MVSELQRQLALHRQTRGVGSSSTASCSSARRQHAAPSLLFDPRKAASIDIETLRDVALTSLQSLSRREPLVEVLEPFFSLSASRQGKNSHQSRDFMTEDQARVLDRRVALCCDLLGPFFLLQDAQYLLEYLLRQYAIHQHNQDALLALALPYHNSPAFVRLVRLMALPPQSPWIFLERMRASGAPLQRRDLVKVVLSSPFLLQFLVDTVARVSAPLSAARLKEANLSPLPSHLQDGKAGNDEILLVPTSRLPAQNTPLLSFFTLLVSESIVAAPSLAAVRTLTPCLLPFLLSTLHPTSAVRTPELHAAGLAILTQIAMRAPLDPAILVAAMQQLSQTLVLSAADDGLPRLSASKENGIFSLLVLIADKQSLDLQGTLPSAVTRRLIKWTRLAAATEELLSDRQLDCAPFLRAFFKSLLSFFLSSSPGSAASFSPLQERLLASAEALCGACAAAPASRSRHGPASPFSPSLSQTEASPSLIVIALTLFDSFRRAGQHALQVASERGRGKKREEGDSVAASDLPSLSSCVEEEHPLFFAALGRLLLQIDAANPLSLPKALTFFSRATEQERHTEKPGADGANSSCEDLVLLLSRVFDGLPSLGCPLYSPERFGQSEEGRLAHGRDGGPGVKALSLFTALMASEVELRREGIRAALACFQRSKRLPQHENPEEEKEERGAFLVELLLDRLQDEEPSLVVEAARGTATVCRVLSPFVCLHRATSVLFMDLASLLPSPLAASGCLSAPAFFSGGVSEQGAEKSRASQCLVASVLLVPRLRVVVPALLHAAAQMLKQEAEDTQAGEEKDDRERFAEEVLTCHLLPLALALAWGTSRPEEKGEGEKIEDEEENSSALRDKRKAFEELHAASLAVLNVLVHRRREREGKGENVEQLEVSTSQKRLASSTAFHALVRQVLLPLSSPRVTSTTALRRMQSSLVVDAFLERETRLKTERREANASATSATCLYTAAALLEIAGATIVYDLSPSSDVPVWMFHVLHLCEFLQGLLATSAAEKTDSDFLSEKQEAKKTRSSAAPSAVSSLSDPYSPALSFPREARSAVKAVAAGVASFLLSRVPKGAAGATAEKTKKKRSHRASGSREETREQGVHAEDGDGVSGLPAALCSFFGSAEEEDVGTVEEPIEGSEKSERCLRRRLLLLALSDLALFAPVVQSFLSAFQGHRLLFLALLSQFLSSVSFSQSRWSGAAPEGSDGAPAHPPKQGEDEETAGAEAACSAFPASSCVSSCLWTPTEAGELLASSPLRQQIEVNLVDLSRALLAQAGRGAEKRMQKSESKASEKKREECADMRDSETREKGAERRADATCVGLLVVPLWLSVHGRAEVHEVREAVHLLLNELLSLLKRSQKTREKSSQKAKSETGASGVSPSLLKLWWRRLAHLGLLRRMHENVESAGDRPKNPKMHFFLQAVLQDAQSSCREFLSLFLSGLSSASSALRASLPSSQASHLRAEGPPSAVASVEDLVFSSAVTTASDGVSAFLCFAHSCLLPAGKAQQAFAGLLRRGPPSRLLPALLPALEEEIEAFVEAFGSSECPVEREKSRSPSFQSAQSSPPASPSSFAFASPAPASPRDALLAPLTISPKTASLSPVIQLASHLLGTLNVASLSPAAVLGPAAVKVQPLQESLPTSRLSPEESRLLVSCFLLPFLRTLSSPVPAASLRSFYLRPGEAPFAGDSSGSASRPLPLDFDVAQAAEAVIDGVFSSGLLLQIPDDICLSLVLAVLRLASTTPQLAARLRLQDEALENAAGGFVSAATSRAPPKARPRSEAMVPVATLVRLIQAIGAEEGEGGAPPAAFACMRIGARDALLADFVESQLHARSSFEGPMARHHRQRDKKAGARKQGDSDTREELERLARCALEKVKAILNRFLASTKRSDEGTNSACNPSEKEGMEEAATRRTLESLLSMCAAAYSAAGAGEAELSRRKNSPKAERHSLSSRVEVAGDRFDAGLPAHEEALRDLASVSRLLAQTCSPCRDESAAAFDAKAEGRGTTRGFTSSLVTPGLLAALLRSCASASERVSLSVKGRDKSAEPRVSSLHRALLDLLHALGSFLARAGLASSRLVAAPLVLSALRGYLPSLFSALDCLLSLLRGGEKPRGMETLEAQTPKARASAKLAEEERREREVKKEVFGLVQMLVEPLSAAAFECLREQEKEGNSETGEGTVVPHSERVQRQAAVAELVVALGAALGREALVAGCLAILVRWEAASLKRQDDTKGSDEAASASDEADEGEDEENPQPAVATEVEGESDDEVLLDKRARKERRKSERSGWGTRRALLERLKEIFEAASGPDKPVSFGSHLLAHAQLATGAVALQCEAREQLLSKNASTGKRPQTAASKEAEPDKEQNGLAVTEEGGFPSRNLPSCVAERVTCVRQGLRDPKRREALASVHFSLSDDSGSVAEGHLAEIYCRAASTAVLLVYEQLKKEGLPNLERVGALSSTAFVLAGEGEEEAQATQELVEALLSVKILAERRWLSGTASLSRSAKKRREVQNASEETELGQRVFAEEAILKQRAELLLESIIRALSPLVGCMRLALGCLGVRHAFFVSSEPAEELRRRLVEAKAGRGKNPQGDLTLASRRSSLTESDEETETSADSQPSIHLLLPSFPSPPLFSAASSTSLPEAARLLLAGEAAHAAAEAVAEADSFTRAPHVHASSCDFVFFSLLFRGLACHLESCLGAPAESVLTLDGGKKKRRDDARKGTEDRLWITLFASSAWSEASLTAPYALLLSLLAKRLLDPSARSSDASLPVTAAGVSAWQLVTRLSRLAGGYLPEAFRDGALPSILLTLKKASTRIPSLALEASSGAAQANLRSLVALAIAAARSLLALTLTSQGRAGEKSGASMGQKTSRSLHAAALFLADFNTLFFRLAGLLRKLLPSLLDEAALQKGHEACAGLMWTHDVLNRLLLVRDSRIAELATCLLAALLGLLQRVGTDFFLPHASTLINTTLLNPLLVSALSHDASEGLASPCLSLKALAAPEKGKSAAESGKLALDCMRRLATPRAFCDASLQFYMVDASVDLPRVRRIASEVLEQSARQNSAFGFSSSLFGKREKVAPQRLGQKAHRALEAETPDDALWRERPVVDTMLSALAAELATSMRFQATITLLLPSLHGLLGKQKKAVTSGEKKRKEKASKAGSERPEGPETEDEDYVFSKRGLQDFQASQTIKLLGAVIGAQPQSRADAKRPVLTKLMVHLVQLCLSRAEDSSACAASLFAKEKKEEKKSGKKKEADGRMLHAERLAEQIFGGQVQDVHRQLLWGPESGDSRDLFLNDLPEDEEELNARDEVQEQKKKRPRDEGRVLKCEDGEREEFSQSASLRTIEQSVRLLPPAAFAPAYLHRVEAALYCAFRSWSQKLSMQQLQAFLQSLLRSLRGSKRALLQPSAEEAEASDTSKETEETDTEQGTDDEIEREASKTRKQKAGQKRTEKTLTTPAAASSIREICGTRLLVLFYTAAVRDFGSVGGVEALLEDLLADFQSALAACRDQALALLDASKPVQDSGEKRGKGGSGSRGRVLESSATWFWFELGMPILLALIASLRSWKKELSGALPPSLFERLLTCVLDASDVLAVLPRLPLPGYSSRDEERFGSYSDTSGEREARRKRAQAQRLSKLWFCALRSLVTSLFEHAFGDKTRVEELNLSLLEKVRSCGKANVHFAAARIYLHLWKRLGVAMVDTLNDSLQTLVELLESPDDEVEMATREWIKAMENLTGESLDDKLKA